MKTRNILPLLLAVLLQALPMTGGPLPARLPANPDSAFVARPEGRAAASLGGYDAVSSATTVINPPYTITGAVGQPLASRRLTTSGHVAESWSSTPSPPAPGVTLNSSTGTITGTPTVAGTFPATITGWEFSGNQGPSTSSAFTFDFTAAASPPTLTSSPSNVLVMAGANPSFTIGVSSSTPVFYHWQFGGTNLAGATNSTLQLKGVQVAQSGVYTVTATNSAGAVSAQATLSVEISPSVTNQPSSQIVSSGAVVNFSVSANGTPLTYQWLFNSNIIANAASPALSLTNVTPAQSGFYAVLVSNAFGSVTSQQAQLLVVPPPGQSAAPVLSLLSSPSGQILLGFSTLPGYNYSVQSADDLTANLWVTLTNLPAAFTGSAVAVAENLSNAPGTFYRVLMRGN
jgi:hypothetical protein